MKKLLLFFSLFAAAPVAAQTVWTPDLGNGKYKNPVLYADYSDPDVVRTGDDYWMTSSSFNCVPGLQILHSTDLVNWEIVNTVFAAQPPYDHFDKPRHGEGVWAPSIRFHDGWYYIYWGNPYVGIYMTKAQDRAASGRSPCWSRRSRASSTPAPCGTTTAGPTSCTVGPGRAPGLKAC